MKNTFAILGVSMIFVTRAFACQSPVGEWHAEDELGPTKLVFTEDGKGEFDPGLGDSKEAISWEVVSPQRRPDANQEDFEEETNVIKITYHRQEGVSDLDTVEYVLCTKRRILGQIYFDGEYYSYTYSKVK